MTPPLVDAIEQPLEPIDAEREQSPRAVDGAHRSLQVTRRFGIDQPIPDVLTPLELQIGLDLSRSAFARLEKAGHLRWLLVDLTPGASAFHRRYSGVRLRNELAKPAAVVTVAPVVSTAQHYLRLARATR